MRNIVDERTYIEKYNNDAVVRVVRLCIQSWPSLQGRGVDRSLLLGRPRRSWNEYESILLRQC